MKLSYKDLDGDIVIVEHETDSDTCESMIICAPKYSNRICIYRKDIPKLIRILERFGKEKKA